MRVGFTGAGFVKEVPLGAGLAGGDPARVAAQIVSGVGFLGAGTISPGRVCHQVIIFI